MGDRGSGSRTNRLPISDLTSPISLHSEAAGIANIVTKSLGSANPHNVVRATVAGLDALTDPATIARLRGKDLEELTRKSA